MAEYHLAAVVAGGLCFFAVSEIPAAELGRFAEEFRGRADTGGGH